MTGRTLPVIRNVDVVTGRTLPVIRNVDVMTGRTLPVIRNLTLEYIIIGFYVLSLCNLRKFRKFYAVIQHFNGVLYVFLECIVNSVNVISTHICLFRLTVCMWDLYEF